MLGASSGETGLNTVADKRGAISEFFSKFPSDYKWMDGRSVYWRPESRASTAAKRDIIENERERNGLTHAYVKSAIERQQLTEDDIEDEIQEMRKWQRQQMGQDEQAPGV